MFFFQELSTFKMTRPAGVPNMNDKDKLLLLKIIKKILPRGTNQWKKVEEAYNKLSFARAVKDKAFKHYDRNHKTVKNTFEKILNQKKPTG